jgi:uncharacterized repeat protein (TIGR04076 family)
MRVLGLAERRHQALDAGEVFEIRRRRKEEEIDACLVHPVREPASPVGVVEHGPSLGAGVPPAARLAAVTEMTIYDVRVTVERIEGRSVCGLEPGDYFEVTESSRVRIPEGRHFCLYALSAVLPLLPAKQRKLPDEDWLEQETFVACPDAEERLIMRIERIGERTMRSEDLT